MILNKTVRQVFVEKVPLEPRREVDEGVRPGLARGRMSRLCPWPGQAVRWSVREGNGQLTSLERKRQAV